MCAQSFHARRVAQIQTIDLQTVGPFAEVRFLGIALRGIPGEPRCHNQGGSGTQQLNAGLVANLDTPSGQQRYTPPQVGKFRSLHEVKLGALRTHLVVKMVDHAVVDLANVAVVRIRGFRVLLLRLRVVQFP